MKKIIQLVFCLFAVQQGLAQSVYDCNAYNPLVTQAEIMAVPYEFNKQCILFDQPYTYSFSGNVNRMVSAATKIHLKPGVHIGPFTGNGTMWLKIKDQKEFDVAVMNYADLNNVLKFEKLELGITLPADILEKVNNFVNNSTVGEEDKLNPYLDWKTRVYAEFRPVDVAFPFVIDGFYTKEFTPWMVSTLPPLSPGQVRYSEAEYEALGGYTENPTDFPFRVRFAPNKVGKWKALVKIEVNGILVHTSSVFEFNVIESDNPGYVRVGINKRYLRREGTFYPLGCNLNWPETDSIRDYDLANKLVSYNSLGEKKTVSEGYMHKVVKPRVYDKYRDYMNLLADGGANYYRSIMYPSSTELEWEHLGDYTKRLSMAQEMDSIVNTAKARDLFIHWNMQIHYSFQYSQFAYLRYWCWQSGMISEGTTHNFAYRSVIPSDNPVDFLTDTVAKKYYKQRLRYILARWGYSTNVAVWELFSEISNVGTGAADDNSWYLADTNWVRYRDWQVEMADYLKTMYHGQCHLVTSSYGGAKHEDDNTFNSPSMDIMTSNIYDFEQPDFANFYINNVSGLLLDDSNPTSYSAQNTKPMIFSESDPIDAMCDNTKLEGHRAIWQSVFSGLAGSLSWDMQLHPQHFGIYGQIRNFIDGIDFDAEGWHPGSVDQSLIYDFDNSTTPPTFNGLLYNYWNHIDDYAKYMDGFVDPPGIAATRLKKADLVYLRSANNQNCIGVLSNKTFNIRTKGSCYTSSWNYSTPLNTSSSSIVQTLEEDLILKKLNLVKKKDKYLVNYYYRNNLNTPVYTQIVNLNQPKLDMTLGTIFNNYIVPFKANNLNQIATDLNSESINSDDSISKDDVLSEFLDNSNLLSSNIEIYPNPTDGDIYIEFGDQIGKSIYIKSLEGKILLSISKCEEVSSLNLDSLNSGIYTIEIFVENGLLYTEKIIKL